MRLLSLAAVLLTAAPLLAQKEFGFDNRKGSGQPYLTPDETVAKFKVAPEFEVKLFAGEPDVVNPIAFTIDEKGRVWLIECFEYPKRTPKGKAPRDRIVILEDTDGDGKCDKRTVFAEGKDFPVPEERKKAGLGAFDMASGIEVGHGGVYVGAPPYLWFIENKDDKPGKIETLLKGFGSEDTHETLNTFLWGPDGWLYGLHGIFTHSTVKPTQADGPETRMNAAVWRFHPRTKKFEIFAEGTSNPWGLDWRNTDGQFIEACCVIPHLFHMVPGGVYKRQAGQNFNPYAYGQINEICDHTFHRESGWAHAGLISLDVPHIPEKYRNSVIFGSIHGCSLKRNTLKPNGSTFTASRADDFLVSGDKNVRPINLRWGPAGDIYLIDWHDQNPCHQTKPDDWDYERGRVYRIQLKGTQPKKAEDLGKKTPTELVALAKDPDPYRYRTALRLIAGLSREDRRTIVDRITTRPGHDIRDVETVNSMTGQPELGRGAMKWDPKLVESDVWSMVVRWASTGRFDDSKDFIHNLAECAEKTSLVANRRELASAAVRLADQHDVRPLLHALMQRTEDANDPVIPVLLWLAYEKVVSKKTGASTPVDGELAWLAEQSPKNLLVRDQIVPRVMRRLVATGQPDDLEKCLKFVADVTHTHTREKALDGLAVALKGQSVKPPPTWPATRDAVAKAGNPKLDDLLNRLAVSFRDPAAVKRALAVLNATNAPDDRRIEAVRELAELRADDAVPLFRTLAGKTDAPVSLRVEAVRALAGFARKDIPDAVLAGWKTYPPAVKAEAVTLLAGRKEWAADLLRAMQAGTVERAAVSDNAIVRIEAFEDAKLNDLIAKAWGRSRPTPKELTAQIDKARELLKEPGASFARGKRVFEAQCAKCHKFEGTGNDVGPPLDGAGRDIEYILANVIDPNRVIGSPYFQRIVTTVDGLSAQGLLTAEDDRSITLKLEGGAVKRFEKADLDGPVKVVERSMMPEGLTAGMTPQDFRDLVRYVMAHPFITTATVNGKPVSAGVGGLIALPADPGEVVIEATVDATAPVKTQVLVGTPGTFAVKVNGKPVGSGTGTDRRTAPDRFAFPVELAKGSHTLTLTVRHKGAADGAFVRFLDPDRALRYPDSGTK